VPPLRVNYRRIRRRCKAGLCGGCRIVLRIPVKNQQLDLLLAVFVNKLMQSETPCFTRLK